MPEKKLLTRFGLAALLIFLIAFSIYLGVQSSGNSPFAKNGNVEGDDPIAGIKRTPREPYTSPRTDGRIAPGSGDVIAGGVERPATDVTDDDERVGLNSEDEIDQSEGTELDYGKTPGVDPDANPSVALAAAAIQNGTHPERLNAGLGSKSAEQFDQGRFDPKSEEYDEEYHAAYVRTPEPGRVWHPAQPGPGVPRIRPLMQGYVYVKQGEQVTLRVSGTPGQPVTFTSFDLGMFENQLTTITVVANDQGVAETQFLGVSGTADDVSILAASPVMSGQARLTVHVIGPNDAKFHDQ